MISTPSNSEFCGSRSDRAMDARLRSTVTSSRRVIAVLRSAQPKSCFTALTEDHAASRLCTAQILPSRSGGAQWRPNQRSLRHGGSKHVQRTYHDDADAGSKAHKDGKDAMWPRICWVVSHAGDSSVGDRKQQGQYSSMTLGLFKARREAAVVHRYIPGSHREYSTWRS